MRRRPQENDRKAIGITRSLKRQEGELGLVLSGGGTRAAYQVGSLKALAPAIENLNKPISIIVGSSIGAVNGLVLAAGLKHGLPTAVEELASIWRERTYRNSFAGAPSMAFFRAIKVAALQYLSPGPSATGDAVFDPTPLMNRIDSAIEKYGGLAPENRSKELHSVAVMTTIEGVKRKPLLFMSSQKRIDKESMHGASFDVAYINNLHAKHGFASAALPSVLPPVELDTEQGKVRLVDGGISNNIPVDPAVRMGAQQVIILDISGRSWWLDRYNEPHDTRPEWEVAAQADTFCLRPPDTVVMKNLNALGPILKYAVGRSTKKFMTAVGPVWPLFALIKQKLGEDVAYEVMSYVALDEDYVQGLLEAGYNETTKKLKDAAELHFAHFQDYHQLEESLTR